MRQRLEGALLLLLLLGLYAFMFQRPDQRKVPQVSPSEDSEHRFVIYDPGGSLPLLLDTRTGRTWYRQIEGSGTNEGGLYWTPVKITPADTGKFGYQPLKNDR